VSDAPVDTGLEEKRRRMAETVRLVLARRERAPRSPRMERALKRLIWRYTRSLQDGKRSADVQE
jgi:hypothetical protein